MTLVKCPHCEVKYRAVLIKRMLGYYDEERAITFGMSRRDRARIRGTYQISDTRFLTVVFGTNRSFADRANELFFEMLNQIEAGQERTDPLGFHSWETDPIDTQEV